MTNDDAGPLLVRSGLISHEQMTLARQAQAAYGGSICENLVLQRLLDDEYLTGFFRERLMVPQVHPRDLEEIPVHILAAVPRDMATEFRVLPVKIDRDNSLVLVMSDPCRSHAVDEIAFFTGAYIVRAVATQRQIAWCLARHYSYVTPLAKTLVNPSAASPPPSDEIVPLTTAEAAVALANVDPEAHARRAREQHARVRAQQTSGNAARLEVSGELVTAGLVSGELSSPDPISARKRTVPMGALGAHAADRSVSGELEVRGDHERQVNAEPAVVVAVEPTDSDRAPILLEPKARPKAERARAVIIEDSGTVEEVIEAENDDDGVVLLDTPKKRRPRRTVVGVGLVGSTPQSPPRRRASSGAPASDPRTSTLVPGGATPKGATDGASANAGDAVSPDRRRTWVPGADPPRENEEHQTDKFARMDAAELASEVDDGWGPPGTTIPPPFLGAMPGTEIGSPLGIPLPEDETDSGSTDSDATAAEHADGIPVADSEEETAPHMTIEAELPDGDDSESGPVQQRDFLPISNAPAAAAPVPTAPPSAKTMPPIMPAGAYEPPLLGTEPERPRESFAASSARLAGALYDLEEAETRDAVIGTMVQYLAGTCVRAAFFAVNRGQVSGWAGAGRSIDEERLGRARLQLDVSSTFQDVVRSRLPYRGPVDAGPTRRLLLSAFNEQPTEIIALPIMVRGRVVGILYGEGNIDACYDEHLAGLSRGGGLALERILKSKLITIPPLPES